MPTLRIKERARLGVYYMPGSKGGQENASLGNWHPLRREPSQLETRHMLHIVYYCLRRLESRCCQRLNSQCFNRGMAHGTVVPCIKFTLV